MGGCRKFIVIKLNNKNYICVCVRFKTLLWCACVYKSEGFVFDIFRYNINQNNVYQVLHSVLLYLCE